MKRTTTVTTWHCDACPAQCIAIQQPPGWAVIEITTSPSVPPNEAYRDLCSDCSTRAIDGLAELLGQGRVT